jgi:hypothetical protein
VQLHVLLNDKTVILMKIRIYAKAPTTLIPASTGHPRTAARSTPDIAAPMTQFIPMNSGAKERKMISFFTCSPHKHHLTNFHRHSLGRMVYHALPAKYKCQLKTPRTKFFATKYLHIPPINLSGSSRVKFLFETN